MAGTALSNREELGAGTVQEIHAPRKRTMSAATRRRAVTRLSAWYGDRCWYCGEPFDDSAHRRTIDHVVPWSRGGANALTNLRLACSSCNAAKGCDESFVGAGEYGQ